MKKQETFSDCEISSRTTLQRGDRFRVGGGPTIRGGGSPLRGLFEFRSAVVHFVRGRRRVFIEAVRIESGLIGAAHTFYVEGADYRRADLPGITFKPYTIRHVR